MFKPMLSVFLRIQTQFPDSKFEAFAMTSSLDTVRKAQAEQ